MDLDELPLGRIATNDFAYCRVIDRMLMYERRIESSLHKTMRELERLQMIRQVKQQYDEQELEPATQNTTVEKNGVLKKQTNFVPGDIDAKSYMKGDYDNIPLCGAQQNKAKKTQILVTASPKGARNREKSVTTANQLAG